MSTSRVKSAERVLDVLDLLARRGVPMAAIEISSALDLPKSTTHHLLNVMRDRRFVSYWPDQRAWTLGVSAFEVGASYMRSGPLHREGQRYMVELTKAADETSHLAVLQGTDVIYLDKREPLKPGVRLVTEVGTRLPAHLTAVGRSILARLDPEQLSALYAGYSWPTRTGEGPPALDALRELLRADREQGYAVERDSTTNGVTCIASPVVTRDGRPVAALGIAFLTGSRADEASAELAALVVGTTARFSASLSDRMVEQPIES
ncbi:IclR family transcriptional regulator [Rhodococcus sp. ABRD24]|uniref:IclR family transcriptional regulator n=1 Tax=Rhodococcus sp. ABRD24 TaxID=2507582 RepID=UPI00103CBF21|nr:IclR family transcriptional regulator [Rhodococcus sp. ABRD24]QBJ96131.1 IclR family transcriptional regulator [Rhodococcus sp. ABRD24]